MRISVVASHSLWKSTETGRQTMTDIMGHNGQNICRQPVGGLKALCEQTKHMLAASICPLESNITHERITKEICKDLSLLRMQN